MKKKRTASKQKPKDAVVTIDLGPLQTIEDCQEALRRLARACAAGENVNLNDCAKAGDIVGELLRFKLAEEEQRIELALRGHGVH